MDDKFDLIDRWVFDRNDYAWKVKLLNGKIVSVGDNVLVQFSNGTFRGRVKQVVGFGSNEDRAVISIVFPGKSNGKKVHIDKVIDKC